MRLKDAEKLARKLLDDIGLTSVPFEFSNAKMRLGGARFIFFENEWVCTSLELSKPITLINSKKVIKEIVLHEIAHIMAGHDHLHDEVWKECARHVGANPSYGMREVNFPEGRYKGNCPVCGKIFYRYRKHKRINDMFVCSCKEGEFKFKDTEKGKK